MFGEDERSLDEGCSRRATQGANDAVASATFGVLEAAVLGRGLQTAAGDKEGSDRFPVLSGGIGSIQLRLSPTLPQERATRRSPGGRLDCRLPRSLGTRLVSRRLGFLDRNAC